MEQNITRYGRIDCGIWGVGACEQNLWCKIILPVCDGWGWDTICHRAGQITCGKEIVIRVDDKFKLKPQSHLEKVKVGDVKEIRLMLEQVGKILRSRKAGRPAFLGEHGNGRACSQ